MEIMKGKRTKRPRHPSPISLRKSISDELLFQTESATSSNTSASPATSSTEEEEDMANCLILLAQSTKKTPAPPATAPVCAGAVAGGGSIFVYQCKTCDRCFSSFQALGGHRASHKKPKSNNEINTKFSVTIVEEEGLKINENNTELSLGIISSSNDDHKELATKKKSKVHECLICGAEFISGQALGGHMRRHRPVPASISTNNNNTTDIMGIKKSRNNVLGLDLNLPAPEDDHQREVKFGFGSNEQVIVFSGSNLVDCHY